MAGQQKAQGIAFSPPTLGVNFRDPLSNLDPRYSPWMLNIIADNQFLRTRKGTKAYATGATSSHTIASAGVLNATIYGYDNNAQKIVDLTSSGSISGGTDVSSYFNTDKVFTSNFAGSLFFFDSFGQLSSHPGVYYNSGWNAINYSYATSGFYPAGAIGFKGRHYLIHATKLIYEWSGIGALTGSTAAVDLTTIFTSGTAMSWVAVFNAQDGNVNDIYIAFCNDQGEVLVYSGDDPLSNTWALKQRFFIGKPLVTYPYNFNQVIPFEGDSLVITTTGLVSLRSLLTNGQEGALSKTVSNIIDPYWIEYIRLQGVNSLAFFWSGCFFSEQKQLVIAANGALNVDGSFDANRMTFFVLNTTTGAWSIHTTTTTSNSVFRKVFYANSKVFFIISGGTSKSGTYQYDADTTFQDVDPGTGTVGNYSFNIYSYWNNLINQITTKQIGSLETFVYSDLFTLPGALKCAISVDFGRKTSAQAENILPASQAGYQKLKYQLGEDGTYFQFQIIGTTDATKTLGYKLFAANVILEQGGIGV